MSPTDEYNTADAINTGETIDLDRGRFIVCIKRRDESLLLQLLQQVYVAGNGHHIMASNTTSRDEELCVAMVARSASSSDSTFAEERASPSISPKINPWI